ncbi:MAG: hypothetical protein JWN62_784 [Acidimicrobiales bacterium]|nr:hypothetical protein [Acidimicrobiales bacterium]
MTGPTQFSVEQALTAQADSCALAGSPLYATLLRGLVADHRVGGVTATLLEGVSEQPVHDALPLRYLATAHRLALAGGAPELAAQYPSCGGEWAGDPGVVEAFLHTAAGNPDEFFAGLRRNVQTNEVGRAAVLASGFAWIARRFGLPLDQIELGASAGLLSRWDHFGYDTGRSRCGDATSELQFGADWWQGEPPDLSGDPTVIRRRASDITPIDIRNDVGRTTMVSFVWPDQLVRVRRLQTAIEIARAVPLQIDPADAGAWLTAQLAPGLAPDAATVVFHSIVWQYLPAATRDAVRSALHVAGERATRSAPLCWLRMEPATSDHADLRVTTWPGGDTRHLADVGYHGAYIHWLAPGE